VQQYFTPSSPTAHRFSFQVHLCERVTQFELTCLKKEEEEEEAYIATPGGGGGDFAL